MKPIDIPLGKKVKYKGKHGVCECTPSPSNEPVCRQCILNDLCRGQGPGSRILCCSDRKDNKDVYFPEVKEQPPCPEQNGDSEWCQ